MIRRRRIVKFETRKITIVRAATETIYLWCELCGASVAMVTPESAAEILMTNPRAIYRRVETGDLHFIEVSAGELLICRESLRAQASLPAIVSDAQSE
jgi:hypothetical protein